MFTGIIEQTVRVIGIVTGPMFLRLTLTNPWDDVRHGESIAVNGCCLTVAEFSPASLAFDVIPETQSRTNLGLLAEGDRVHVERSLRVGDRIDGHFVQGHIDGLAKLADQIMTAGESRLALEIPDPLAKYVTPKGSVAIDGVSLTVASVKGNRFEVALIPTTLQLTCLGERPIGWPFNFEADMLNKTVVNYLERQTRG